MRLWCVEEATSANSTRNALILTQFGRHLSRFAQITVFSERVNDPTVGTNAAADRPRKRQPPNAGNKGLPLLVNHIVNCILTAC